jgi:hypothetical protein
MDVSTAFLNGELDQEIYMKQPEGFIVKGKEHCICRLRKALYGLKQGSRQWYKKLDETLRGKLHFTRTYADAGIYVLRSQGGDLEIILIVYVDDILLTGPNSKRIKEIMQKLSSYFKMKLLGSPSDFLSLCIEQDRSNRKMRIHQIPYLLKVLKKFNLNSHKTKVAPLPEKLQLIKNMAQADKASIRLFQS